MMDEEIIKLECLRLAQTGAPETSIASAQKYFDWIVGGEKKICCKKKKAEKSKQGRPPKKD